MAEAATLLTQAGKPYPRPPLEALDVSVVIPCLSEEKGIGWVIDRAFAGLAQDGLCGEVLVVDNGSEDRSPEIARERGARVIFEDRRGYGYAYQRGFAEAVGDIIVMADADATYDLGRLPEFVAAIREGGSDLVLGARLDGIEPGAMPLLHRLIGNPFFSWFFSAAYSHRISDVNSGMRAFRRRSLPVECFTQGGMEFALEMLVLSVRRDLRITEIPITYQRREGESKLRTWQDGWRSLRYLAGSKLAPGPRLVYDSGDPGLAS